MNESSLYANLGSLVRSHREMLGKTQADIGNAIGLTRASVANIESGRQRILLHQLFDLAFALEVAPGNLLPIPVEGLQNFRNAEISSSLKLSKIEKESVAMVQRTLSAAGKRSDQR